jgi:hypothetical protein
VPKSQESFELFGYHIAAYCPADDCERDSLSQTHSAIEQFDCHPWGDISEIGSAEREFLARSLRRFFMSRLLRCAATDDS